MPVTLGPIGVQFFSYMQMRGQETVRTGDLVEGMGLSPDQERTLLSRLAKQGLVSRVRRGLYLVPQRLPPGGKWTPGEIGALETLMNDRGGRYQITGPSAFYHYGWIDQVPARVYAYNDQLSGDRKIGGAVELTLIKVSLERLGETETEPNGAVYSSRERALVDAVYDWSRFNTIPRAYSWIDEDLKLGKSSAEAIARIARRYGNTGTLRRVGMALERSGANNKVLRSIESNLKSTSAFIPMEPDRPKRGETNRRWGVVLNDT